MDRYQYSGGNSDLLQRGPVQARKGANAAAAAGAHIIGVHTGIDQQIAGQTPFADLANLLALNLPVKVSVAGGIKQATVQDVVKAGANIIVVGGAITGAKDPGKAAAEIRALVDAA
jgi:3-keto-L-gulonate-6-phosphate decarboxylase